MSVQNVNGQIIYEEMIGQNSSVASFDASSVPAGIYMISFVSNEINVVQKIIVR
jgi:hypothetical protein